jgi:hypothetical protein
MLLAEDLKIIFAMESVCHSWRSILAEPETWNAMYHSRWCLILPLTTIRYRQGTQYTLTTKKKGAALVKK